MPDPASGGAGVGNAPLPPPFVHPTAVVDAGAVLSPGVKVWHFSHVSAGARLGRGASLGQNVFVAPNVSVGAGCKLQNNVSLYEGVTLEDEVFVGPSAVFTNVATPRAHVVRRGEYAPTLVRRHATIGANATIVCGVTLGEGAFVGAGAVVTADVAPYTVVLGVPARPAGFACVCGEMLVPPKSAVRPAPAAMTCGRCTATYRPRDGGGLERTGGGSGGGAPDGNVAT